ncbi:MAG: SPOR domain-containing protein [Proteobacteria bacterium]|nr:SPOR domain-containing protein [Pseudomonadota bacterium]
MHQRLKERLVGAAVLVIIAVIFIPMILTGPVDTGSITKTNIPERPTEKFESKLVPITEQINPVISETRVEADTNIESEVNTQVEDVKTGEQTQQQPGSISTNKTADKQVGLTAWVVQMGSFTSKVNADQLKLKLQKSGFTAFVEPITQDKETVYRVRVGPELLRSDADKLLKNIKSKMDLEGMVLSYP